jgi:hypothetical protein
MPKEPIDITPDDSFGPVFLIEATDAEIAEREAEHEAQINARQARQTKLDSAITKLKTLGLTESEAKIIIGLE